MAHKTADSWFTIDKEGLADILERKGKEFALFELVSNAWDTDATRVEILLQAGARGKALLQITDNSSLGFTDLSHAHTLFAPSEKKGQVEKRGRFNLGEKLVLAIADSATITSTTGTILFKRDGTRQRTNVKCASGSFIEAVLRLTVDEVADIVLKALLLIPPSGVTTIINGEALAHREPLQRFEVTLPTEIADADGRLRRTERKTIVKVYERQPLQETAYLYEMGIPVVETSMNWDVSIEQKVPLSLERDSVTPAFMRKVRTAVLDAMFPEITSEDANQAWVRDALPYASAEAVAKVVTERFGDKIVAFDPSDQEANNLAVSQGYTLVHGRSLSKEEWQAVKTKAPGLIRPAGQVTPSNSMVHTSTNGKDPIPHERLKASAKEIMDYANRMHAYLFGFPTSVAFFAMPVGERWAAAYSPGRLMFNVTVLGWDWFSPHNQEKIDALLIHEFAHHKVSNHLDHAFHDECCRIGALLRHWDGQP